MTLKLNLTKSPWISGTLFNIKPPSQHYYVYEDETILS